MEKDLRKIEQEASKLIQSLEDTQELEKVRISFLGRKGKLTLILRNIKNLSPSEKPKIGKLSNEIKNRIEKLIDKKIKEFATENKQKTERLDITMPGIEPEFGHLHPITKIYNELFDIFEKMGFSIVEGPEIENDWYNFQALNIPSDHPARDTQDTFYLDKFLLRTHTSPVQIRYMQKNKPPIRIIVPGRVYRRDYDITHTPMFHQLEGLLVDEQVTLADLKGVLETFAKLMFGKNRKVRFRPHYFPFTEPSAEIDISCDICKGKGCSACKYSGWLEILGAGLVHPQILKNSGIDPKKYQGFAFGFGVERIAMLKYNIPDLRLFFENDLRFLEQF